MPKIDVGALWEQSGHWLTDYTAAVIEECAKACEERGRAYKDAKAPGWVSVDHETAQCAAAIRALKP